MLYNTTFSELYQIEGIVECYTYSVLFRGKKSDTGEQVLVRHCLTARALEEEKQRSVQAEVAALQALDHPSLSPLLEVSMGDRGIYLVSAQPSGGTLATHLAQNFLKLLLFDEALRIITQIGQALHALHQRGLCHGNLTPQAVFFQAVDQVSLGEIRLKSVLDCIPNYQPVLEESVPLCWYMAPEQFSGVFDAFTDQYALGCLAYHLFTGRVPFTGSARATLLQKHQQEQPCALSEFNPALPVLVEDAILKALAKQPEARHASIQAFLNALQQPEQSAIADQDTLKNLFFDRESVLTAQTALAQEAFQPSVMQESFPQASVLESAMSPGARFDQTTAVHSLLSSAKRRQSLSSQPFAQAAVARTNNRHETPALLNRAWLSRKNLLDLFSRRRELAILTPAILLVLVLAIIASRLLFFAGTPGQTRVAKPSPHVSQGTPALTSTSETIPVQSTATPTLSPTPQTTATPTLLKITPLLDCITQTGNMFRATFGYQNPNVVAVTIPLGGKNVVSPSNSDGTQPTSFAPGAHHQVFRVTFFKHGTVTWSLNGQIVTADSSSPHC